MMFDSNPLTLSSLIVDPARSASNTLYIVCPLCHLRLSSAFELRRHAMSEHLSLTDSQNRMDNPRFTCQVFTCAMCGVSSSECAAIEEHFRSTHSSPANDHSTKCAILAQKLKMSPYSENSSDSEDEPAFLLIGSRQKRENPNLSNGTVIPATSGSVRPPALSAVRPLTSGAPSKSISSGPPVTRAQNHLSAPGSALSITRPTRTGTPVSASGEAVPRTSTPVPAVRTKLPIPACERPTPQPSKARSPFQNWSELILRSDKKFMCMLCRRCIYSGRTEVVFHAVTRHLLVNEIEHDLSHYARLSDPLKRQIGQYFADGMRIRSGVHYKDAKRVEAALFRSIELHLRYRDEPKSATTTTTTSTNTEASTATTTTNGCSTGGESPEKPSRTLKCSGCGATFTDNQIAFSHVNDELRVSLPEFMRARSCPWSLSTRDEWVWCVLDLPIEPLPGKSTVTGVGGVSDPNEEVQLVLGDRIHKLGGSRASDLSHGVRRGPPAIAPSMTVSHVTNAESTSTTTSSSNTNTTNVHTSTTAATSTAQTTAQHNATVAAAVDVVKSLVAVAGLLQPKSVTCMPASVGPATATIPIATPIFKIEASDPMDQLVVRPG